METSYRNMMENLPGSYWYFVWCAVKWMEKDEKVKNKILDYLKKNPNATSHDVMAILREYRLIYPRYKAGRYLQDRIWAFHSTSALIIMIILLRSCDYFNILGPVAFVLSIFSFLAVLLCMEILASSCIIYRTNENKPTAIMSIISGLTTFITFLVGIFSYIADKSFMMQGAISQLIWIFITIPTLIMTVIQFFIYKRKVDGKINIKCPCLK